MTGVLPICDQGGATAEQRKNHAATELVSYSRSDCERARAEWRAASEPQEPVDQDATARCEFASIGSLQQSEATPSCYMMSHSFVYSYVGRF